MPANSIKWTATNNSSFFFIWWTKKYSFCVCVFFFTPRMGALMCMCVFVSCLCRLAHAWLVLAVSTGAFSCTRGYTYHTYTHVHRVTYASIFHSMHSVVKRTHKGCKMFYSMGSNHHSGFCRDSCHYWCYPRRGSSTTFWICWDRWITFCLVSVLGLFLYFRMGKPQKN